MQHTELYAGIILDFPLQRGGKLRKALVRHDVQDVDIPVFNPFAVLVDAEAQAAPYLLPGGESGFLVDEGADLEHVRVIPALLQRGMGENEAQRAGKAEKPFLVPHDGVVSIVIGLRVAFGILEAAFLVLGKITVVNF